MSLPGPRIAAWVFAGALLVLLGFQMGLALGMPWGAFAMGGSYPGVYPTAMRGAALAQAVIYLVLGVIVFVRAGLIAPQMLRLAIIPAWVVVALMTASLVLNIITPSAGERMLWAPVALVMCLASLRVALARRS